MQRPLQIVFREMEPSPALEELIRQKVEKLEQFEDRVIGCRVTLATPHRHQHKGMRFEVNIDVVIPGGELVERHEHEDAYAAIREAFRALQRQLADTHKKRDAPKNGQKLAS
jgi:ribosomal subunit interface protein